MTTKAHFVFTARVERAKIIYVVSQVCGCARVHFCHSVAVFTSLKVALAFAIEAGEAAKKLPKHAPGVSDDQTGPHRGTEFDARALRCMSYGILKTICARSISEQLALKLRREKAWKKQQGKFNLKQGRRANVANKKTAKKRAAQERKKALKAAPKELERKAAKAKMTQQPTRVPPVASASAGVEHNGHDRIAQHHAQSSAPSVPTEPPTTLDGGE